MKTILVVDDLAIVREPLAAYLRMAGYHTLCASDGDQALAVARHTRPDLVLLDLAMPGLNGLGFLRKFRADARWADIPVIVLTAIANREPVIEAARLGIQEYILKSQFSLSQLVARVRARLGAATPAEHSQPESTPGMQLDEPVEGSVEEILSADDLDHGQDGGTESPTVTSVKREPSKPGPAETVSTAPPAEDAADSPPESIKSLKPLLGRSQITELIDNCGELKALSPTVMQILKLTGSASCSIEQVVRTIKQDHAIALKVLKLANSVVYTRGEPVENVQKAVMRIGLAEIRQAVLNISVIDQFSSAELDRHINTLQFWEHSIACGLICSELARATGANESEIDAFFTMGLLHDVGRLVYAEKLGDVYGKVVETAAALELPLEQVETRLLLVDHASAMDRILHGWRFPKNLINPIAFHHLSMGNIRHMARQMVPQVATLALADRLAHALLLGDSGNATIYQTEEYCRALKLPASVLQDIQQRIPDQTDEMKFAMVSRGTAGDWPQFRKTVQQQLKGAFRPIFISASPDLDAYRILIDRLRTIEGDEPPNIAIVHFVEGRERVMLTTALENAEREAGVANLPVVLISPGAKVLLEDRCMASRQTVRLSAPTHLRQFINSVNQLLSGG